MLPRYPVPWDLLLKLVVAVLIKRRRTFGEDARLCVAKLRPALQVYGREHIPSTGPYLVTINHYARPNFGAWWLALAVSAVLPCEVLWTLTAAWTFHDRLRARLLTPLTLWLFQRVANIYGFITMPPMPPDPAETIARAQAVRRVLSYAKKAGRPVIGIAPEGRDSEQGRLGSPPAGMGRFLLHLSDLEMDFLPVGAYETDGNFCLNFGPLYRLEISEGLPARVRDQRASLTVMLHIARLVPAYLSGIYNESEIEL